MVGKIKIGTRFIRRRQYFDNLDTEGRDCIGSCELVNKYREFGATIYVLKFENGREFKTSLDYLTKPSIYTILNLKDTMLSW